jgi:toxin ParE1/3/4
MGSVGPKAQGRGPMSPQMLLRPRAEEDLRAHFLYLHQFNPAVARRFVDVAEDQMRRLAEFPGAGEPRFFKHPRLRGLRSARIRGFRNYLVFYREVTAGIEVVRVLHAARDLERVLLTDRG